MLRWYVPTAFALWGATEIFEVWNGPRGIILLVLLGLGIPVVGLVCMLVPPGVPPEDGRRHRRRFMWIFAILAPFLVSTMWWWAHEKHAGGQKGSVSVDSIRSDPPPIEHPELPEALIASAPMASHLARILPLSYVDVPGEHALSVRDEHGCRFKIRRSSDEFLIENDSSTLSVHAASSDVPLLELKVNDAYRESVSRYAGELQRGIEAGWATVTPADVDVYEVKAGPLSARLGWPLNAHRLNELVVWEDGVQAPRLRLEWGRVRESGGFMGTEGLATALGRRVALR